MCVVLSMSNDESHSSYSGSRRDTPALYLLTKPHCIHVTRLEIHDAVCMHIDSIFGIIYCPTALISIQISTADLFTITTTCECIQVLYFFVNQRKNMFHCLSN